MQKKKANLESIQGEMVKSVAKRHRNLEELLKKGYATVYKSKTAFGTKALSWDQGLCPLISAPVIRFQSRKVYQRWGMVLRAGGCTLFGVPATLSMASGCLSAKTQKVASKYLHNLFTQEEEF